MENRALTWYKNSRWTASPDSQYQQQQFVQVERLILVTVNTGDKGNPLQRGCGGGGPLLSWNSTACTEADLGGSWAVRCPVVPCDRHIYCILWRLNASSQERTFP